MATGPLSVVLVPIPEADSLVRAWSSPRGLGAHVTLSAPFLDPARLDADVVARLAQCLRGAAVFRVVFDEVRWFADSVVYLAPRETERFVELARRVSGAFPEVAPPARPFVAHLTVAKRATPDDLARAAEAAERTVPLAADVRTVRLVAQSPVGGWQERGRVDLGWHTPVA